MSSTQPTHAKRRKATYDGPAVERLVRRCIDATRRDTARADRDRQDWLNLLFYRGGPDNQWVAWNGAAWQTLPEDDTDYGLPADVPRQATNIYARKIDAMAAILTQADPAQEWRPAKDDDAARATADVLEEALPVLREEIDYARLRPLINRHVCLTDKVGIEVYYDTDPSYGEEFIQAYRCPSCQWAGLPAELEDGDDGEGACPTCGAPSEQTEPLIDAQARPVGAMYPKGRLCARLIPSFELSLPDTARECDERKVPYILMHTQMAREDALRMWPDPKQRALIRSARTETSSSHTHSQYAAAMRNLSSPGSANRHSGSGSNDQVVVWRLVHDPIEKDADDEDGPHCPGGLDAVMIDGHLIDAGPLPVKDDDGRPMKPILLRTFQLSPGSPFGMPPADDLVPLQTQRNLLETLLVLILLHEASPRTYVPTTVTLEDPITGRPGQVIRYRPNMPGDKPSTEPGHNPPEGLYRAIELNDEQFNQVSRLNAVLEGQRPEGAPTLGEIQILRERGMAAFADPLIQLLEFEKRLSYLLLQTARQSMWTPRLIRSVTDGGDWEIRAFTNADLSGSVDCIVNPATAWPKSQLLQDMRIEKALALGLLNPQDPEVSERILSAWDLLELRTSIDVDKRQVARELDRWRKAQSPAEILPPAEYINVAYHTYAKSNFLKSEEAELIAQMNPPVWQAMTQHVGLLQQRQMMEQATAQGAPTAPAAPAQPAGPIGASLETLIADGTLQPAQEPKSPIDALVAEGTLQPSGGASTRSPLDAMLQSGQLAPAPAGPTGGPTGPSIDQLREQPFEAGPPA